MCNNGMVALMRKENKNFIKVTGGVPKKLKEILYVPQFGDKYFFPCLEDGRFCWTCWEGTDEDVERLQLGLVCSSCRYAAELAGVMLGISDQNRAYKPRRGQIYYHPVLEKRLIEIERWEGDDFDIDSLYYGLVCRTEAQAKALARELFTTLWDYRIGWGE